MCQRYCSAIRHHTPIREECADQAGLDRTSGRQVWQPQRLCWTIQQGDVHRELGFSPLGPFPDRLLGQAFASTGSIVMPILKANLKAATLAAHHQLSFEQQVCAWLSSAGWEVLVPLVDHGRKTDLVVAGDEDYYRIQVKSVQMRNAHVRVENKWQGARLDYVVYFSALADWGFITPAFAETSRPLDASGHVRFHAQRTNFLKTFKKI
jgi:hypothetical protein